MDISQWLTQKLDDPWSSYRLSANLTGDIFDQVARSALDLDATILTRLLLAILDLRPAQIRELQVDIDAFLSKCESTLTTAVANDDDYSWSLFLIRSLKGFAKQRRIDVDSQSPDLKAYIDDLISHTVSSEIKRYMIPAEAKYLDLSLLPKIAPECHQHFQVTRPFLFENDTPAEPENASASKSLKSSPVKPSVPARPISRPPPPVHRIVPPPVKRLAPPAFAKKATINRMGLEDVAQLQDRMKRSRPGQDDMKRKEKIDQKNKEKAEKEQKRIEERDLKKRKKEDEKEAKRLERELIKEQKTRAMMEEAQQRENEAMDKAAREAAEAVVRQNAQSMLMNPAHLLAQIQSGAFANPSYPQLMMMVPPMQTPQMDAAPTEFDKSPYASMFVGANALTLESRALIENFLAGEVVEHPDAQNGVLQVVMSENYTQDASLDEYLEIVVFEMNFQAGSWRKLKRRKRLTQQPGKI